MFIIYFCYRCECKTFGNISLEEFSRGLQSFKVEKMADVKPHVIKVAENLLIINDSDFKKFWFFLFTYNCPAGKKVIDFDYVEMFFTKLLGNQFKIVAVFLDYIVREKKKEPMKQDQWNCFFLNQSRMLIACISNCIPKLFIEFVI